MTIEGFAIGMGFLVIAFVAVWALGNVGIENHKKEKVSFSEKFKRHN
ncbi:hypothetical protein WE348_23165 (plasmid) [Alteromonas macleodii]